MGRLLALVVAVLLASCSGGPCKERSGSYKVSFRETSGTCGPASDQIFVVGGASSTPDTSGCRGGSTASADNCSITLDIACTQPSGSSALRGKVVWNGDGSGADGDVSLTLNDGGGRQLCTSVYATTWRRQ